MLNECYTIKWIFVKDVWVILELHDVPAEGGKGSRAPYKQEEYNGLSSLVHQKAAI
jgi:hypothetical protein